MSHAGTHDFLSRSFAPWGGINEAGLPHSVHCMHLSAHNERLTRVHYLSDITFQEIDDKACVLSQSPHLPPPLFLSPATVHSLWLQVLLEGARKLGPVRKSGERTNCMLQDPVTGSAHAVLGPWWASKLGKDRMTARQCSSR